MAVLPVCAHAVLGSPQILRGYIYVIFRVNSVIQRIKPVNQSGEN